MSEAVSRKRLLVSFWGVFGLWTFYGLYLWWMVSKYAFTPVVAFPIAIGGYLLLRGTLLLVNVTPKLFGKNRVT